MGGCCCGHGCQYHWWHSGGGGGGGLKKEATTQFVTVASCSDLHVRSTCRGSQTQNLALSHRILLSVLQNSC